MIQVEHLTKRFKAFTALDDLSFEVAENSLYAFLGTNGAGKSTAISCMTTLLGFDSGTITVDGLRVGADDHKIRDRIGVVFQKSCLDPLLTVEENLRLRAKFYGVPDARIDELAELVGLGEFLKRRYGVLSGGQKRRADIARALMNTPRVLFLDEPTAGLDPQSRDQVWRVIKRLRTDFGLTVVLTTHYMHETEAADHALIIDRGRVLVEGSPMELRAKYSQPELTLLPAAQTPDSQQTIQTVLERRLGEPRWKQKGGSFVTPVPDSATALEILNELDGKVSDFQVTQGSMEDVFLHFTENGGVA
ncbi:ABC transporter ATP-binding protein [Leucobacter sp. cx-328]|uniref:ABC transporter ATP-binding protein n=1 Tax=unclassified Leucobacter TaxID=2621730 RepID=UPI00165E2564|nr:ABC transporter ATP-binding protein [Leucobacter sp. cx-328]